MDSGSPFDIFVIGGGINGAAIARDAAGRGLRVGLAERGDFGGATSSASTKLLHGGLRYLEFRAFALVRKALSERGVIFDAAPQIARPLPFVIPRIRDTRPDWLIRLALFLYDHLGDRGGMPKSRTIRLRQDRAGRGLDPGIFKGWRFSDGWIDDARMVVMLLRDAESRGATLYPRTAVTAAQCRDGWHLMLSDGRMLEARYLVNASGPWAAQVASDIMGMDDPPELRLVQGSHIIVERMTSADDALMIQQPDKRVVFMVPLGADHLMIGTTETEIPVLPNTASPTPEEIVYLLMAANSVLAKPIGVGDIVHSVAGIRPLIVEAGKSARETTRDWRLHEHKNHSAMTVIGGKITTHRLLAEAALSRIAPDSKPWTNGAVLPDSDFEPHGADSNREAYARWLEGTPRRFPDYDPAIVRRIAQRFGREAENMLIGGLGPETGGLFEAELRHFVTKEWAASAEDILWRRTKAGLDAVPGAARDIDRWIARFTSS